MTDAVDGLGQALATGSELFDLAVEDPTATGEVGQDAGPDLLGLLNHGPALGAGLGHQLLGFDLRRLELRGQLLLGPAAEVGGHGFGLGDPVGGVLLGPGLELGGLVLG